MKVLAGFLQSVARSNAPAAYFFLLLCLIHILGKFVLDEPVSVFIVSVYEIKTDKYLLRH